MINKEAIAEYKEWTGDFELGFLATVNKTEGEITPNLDETNVFCNTLSLVNNYADIKVNGIPSDKGDVNVIFCLYVIDGDKLYYLDNGETKTSISGVSYNSVEVTK